MPSYATEVLADSPLLYWRLGEASGLTAADASGNGHTGTYTASGVAYGAAGAVAGNNAILFDGSFGTVYSAALDLSPYSVVTVEVWMKTASFGTTDKLLMETSANANSNNGAFFIDPNDSGHAGKILTMLKGAAGANSAYFTPPSVNVFHHYVFKLRTGTGTGAITCRVDKVDQTMTAGASSASVSAFGNYAVIVASRNPGSQYLPATIDEVAIYGGDVSAARTDAHYDARTIIGSVGRDVDLRTAILAAVGHEIDLRTAIAAAVGTELDARAAILAAVGHEIDLRAAIAAAVGHDLDARAAIAALAARDLDVRWALLGGVGRDVDLRSAVLTTAARELDLRAALLGTVGHDIDLRAGVAALAGRDLDVRSALLALTGRDVDLRSAILNAPVGRELELRAAISALAGHDLELRSRIAHPSGPGEVELELLPTLEDASLELTGDEAELALTL